MTNGADIEPLSRAGEQAPAGIHSGNGRNADGDARRQRHWIQRQSGPRLDVHAAHSPAQIVLLDIGLPNMDGYQVAGRIRAANRAIRIIALTGHGQDDDKQRASAAGFHAHLVKPVDMGALRATLDSSGYGVFAGAST